jgi:hypothetical protein
MKTKFLALSILFSILLSAGARALVFYPVSYKFWTNPISISVGNPIDLPIYVQNLGLLPDTYNVTVAYSGQGANPNIINIGNSASQIERLYTYQIGRTTARLQLISATSGSITLGIYVMSNNDAIYNPSSTCIESATCSYLRTDFTCFSGKCVKYKEIIVKTGMASLPEFGWFGLLQIILIASILAFLKFK